MTFRNTLLASTLIALAACGSGGSDGNGSATAGKSGSLFGGGEVKLQPGQWEIAHEVVSMEAPGMPKEATAGFTGKTTNIKTCITPEQVEKPNAGFFAGQDDGCSYKDFTMAGGRLAGTLTCSSASSPGGMTMKMDGQYGADNYQIAVEMKTDEANGGMTIKAKGAGKRIGDCPAGSEAE